MSYRYAILGAGRQGIAAAYDLARFGDASQIILADVDQATAQAAADRVNRLAGANLTVAQAADVTDEAALTALLTDAQIDALLSAVPYRFNVGIARAAVAAGAHMADLGGNTDVVRVQLALHEQALAAGVSIIPDCGLMPGLGNTLAVYALEQMDTPREVRIWVGGLPQRPRPPFHYQLTFNIRGLTNEYSGHAVYLRDGRITEVEALTEPESIEFPEPVGCCEAFVTSGGTSTGPETFAGRLQVYEEKTVRYPGHLAQLQAMKALGLLDPTPISIDDGAVAPRDIFEALLEPRITFPGDPDVVVLRVQAQGRRGVDEVQVTLDLLDWYDKGTGLTAMERTTGFPAAMVVAMMAQGQTPRGAVPLEVAVPARPTVEGLAARGIHLTEHITITHSH
ncbi:MAG: saccharopine dehydrogenase NADP-binding domain-containing protein [Chloroflexi bacterium]|nr:saccharopine dehydrogenase NADP-binding domain-containing protein [Chloroflexota bacterium]MBU1750932.1 saccharopine dehydrogenase NADP-binding domain-containing protein [Chloroflexota bacterium]MBU1878155.1 saccharopine dehydrogenase NADP-binding domain-containing protein [Chloroflexota bacterium]